MRIETFEDMYVAELQELHSAERELVSALPRFAGSARHDELKAAFNAQLADARSQLERVSMLLQRRSVNPLDHTDQTMQTLLRESERWRSMLGNPNLQDAGLIDSMQRILHYAIAAYGTVTAFAGMLGFQEEKDTLHDILESKKAADRSLTELAKRVVNQDAVVA